MGHVIERGLDFMDKTPVLSDKRVKLTNQSALIGIGRHLLEQLLVSPLHQLLELTAQANQRGRLASGKPHYMHERVDHSEHGKATLSVCKWVDDLDGRRLVFGISFVIPG